MPNEHAGPLLGERDGLRVIDCKACGYAHLETMPNADNLDRFYATSFWQVEKAGALERMEQQREWWAGVYGDWLGLIENLPPTRPLIDVGAGSVPLRRKLRRVDGGHTVLSRAMRL